MSKLKVETHVGSMFEWDLVISRINVKSMKSLTVAQE